MPQTLMLADAKPCNARAMSNQTYPCPTAKTAIDRGLNVCVCMKLKMICVTYALMPITKRMFPIRLECDSPMNCSAI